ncbi:MAG: SMP-30/gluconolactonase/LRE family protein [Flavobacteriaceae bacterium]
MKMHVYFPLLKRSIFKIHFIALLLLFSHSVAQEQQSLNSLTFEKDLIPEGIAIDTKTKKVYINSLKHNKIVRCNLDGSDPENFIEENEYGYLPGFGMTIKGDTLFALGNSLTKTDNKSILLLLNTLTGDLIKSYSIDNSEFIYLNDVAISNDGTLFITDSESNAIYTINKSDDSLDVFYSNDEIKHSNGIALSSDNTLLYFASYASGIRTFDIAHKKLVNKSNQFKGIDGMKFYKNSLIGIVNSRRDASQNGVYRFHLDEEHSKITHQEKLMAFMKSTDIPTTFAIVEDSMCFIADSQMDILDQQTNEIIDASKLEKYQLIKLKLH